jgi:hypothetical protein
MRMIEKVSKNTLPARDDACDSTYERFNWRFDLGSDFATALKLSE